MVVDVLAAAPEARAPYALVTRERGWSFVELGEAVRARADLLVGEGVARGDVIPRVVEPDEEGICELLALWSVGAVVAPLNPRLTATERETAVRTLKALPPGAVEGAQAILWTSGSSGHPRGVALSFAALAASTGGAAERLGLGHGDVWLASLSPAHVGGLALVVRSLLLGGTLVAYGSFDAAETSELIDGRGLPPGVEAPLTHLSVVPTQLLRLLEARGGAPPPPTFRCALVGGARAPEALVERALGAGWPVALTYGLTEATSQVATASPELVRRKTGTVGRPLTGVAVRIGGDGELLVRGATMASRYVGEKGAPLVDVEGWHHTGDVGRLDEDGDLWITGRRIDRIVTGGVTVEAAEVEEVMRGHPGVVDVCVVALPDPEWGERVCAWVVAADPPPCAEDLDAYARGRLSPAKRPRRYHIGAALPLNPNGKVDRNAVRETLTRS